MLHFIIIIIFLFFFHLGARAKSDRGDWIIEASAQNQNFIHVAGIDSPGLAGSPAIALECVHLLQKAGMSNELKPILKMISK